MVTGIICEFNPFHQGHQYLFDQVKQNGSTVVCAMSGNFVQRGEFAVYDKYQRAKTAIEHGADLVIEIPTVCATQSAQGFAKAGITLLESTGICDAIAFGTECDDIPLLQNVADEIIRRDDEIKAELEKGVSYPKARQNVINSPVLDGPNNILAIEYLTYTNLKPIAVKRIGQGHDSADIRYSASEIRKHLPAKEIASMKNCESAVLYKLRTMTPQDFLMIQDVSEGLEYRLTEAVSSATSLEEVYDSVKSKRYTHSRIRRIVLRSFLGITKDLPSEPLYLHILGFSEEGRKHLTEIKKASSLPIITTYGDAKKIGGDILKMYETECRLTDIYNLGYSPARPCGTEQKSRLFIGK